MKYRCPGVNDSLGLYFQDISQYPVLSPNEEIQCVKRIRKGIDNPDDPKLVQEGKIAKDKLIKSSLRLVVSIARKYFDSGLQPLDLIQEGNAGLMKAVKTFDFTERVRFRTYSRHMIEQAIRRAILNQARTIRIPPYETVEYGRIIRLQRLLEQKNGREPTYEEIAAAMTEFTMRFAIRKPYTEEEIKEIIGYFQRIRSLDDPTSDDDNGPLTVAAEDTDSISPEKYADREVLNDVISKMLSTLEDREARILMELYGLGNGGKKTPEEISKEFNVSCEKIGQIEAQAIQKLRENFNKDECVALFLENID